MPRALPAVAIAVVALIGAPVVATAVTASALSAVSSDAGAIAGRTPADEMTPAVLAWGVTGLVGLGAMVAFGATAVRRGGRSAEREALSLVESPIEVGSPTYA